MAQDAKMPFLDLFQDFGKSLNLPAPDVNGIMEYHRKNLQALQAATQVGSSSAQAMMAKQREALEETLADISEMVQALSRGEGATDMASNQMDLARKTFEASLQNFREIAEIAQQGGMDTFQIFRDRMMESVEDLSGKGK